MKKFSTVASAVMLSLQAFLSTPLTVFAQEGQSLKARTGQVQRATKATDTTDTTETSSESIKESTKESTTATSNESSTISSSQSNSEATSSPTKSSESTTPSNQEPPKKEESKEELKEEVKQETQQEEPSREQPIPATERSQESPTPQTMIDQEATIDLSRVVPSSSVTQDGAIYFEKDESVDSFIRKIGESAREIGQEKDLYASVMIAQAILESASGQSQLAKAPNYNLFGIKGTHKGKSVSMATQEDLGNGTLYATQAGFRVYENYEDCFNDYATLLREGLTGDSEYYAGVWKSNAKAYQEATKFLTGRYATDTQYDQKLNGLIETYELTEYDKEIQGASISATGYKIPLNHYTISSSYGNRGSEFHRGLDLAAGRGEPIHASKKGTVIMAKFHYSWGNVVAIEHDDGMTTLYAHQQQYLVQLGDQVEQGQTIGFVGSTGNSTGNHLHFGTTRFWISV